MAPMESPEDDLLAISVDTDDYAVAAAEDAPTVSRTYQSEEAFQAVKANYTAKHDNGGNYEALIEAVPVLRTAIAQGNNANSTLAKVKLSKKDAQLLGYAAGEMYYEREYAKLIALCTRVQDVCEIDERTRVAVERWTDRCHARMTG